MKKFSLLILLTISIFTGCKKDNSPSKSIAGNWELRTEIGGLSATHTNYPSGNGTILKFTKTDYESYSGGKLVKSGTYQIVKDINFLNNEAVNRIVYDGEFNAARFYFTIENNKLTIELNGYDAPATIYEKL